MLNAGVSAKQVHVCTLRTMLISGGLHRHLHQLLELPLEAPGLVYKRMETREAAGAEAADPAAGDALDALAGSPPDPPLPRLRPGAALGFALCFRASVPSKPFLGRSPQAAEAMAALRRCSVAHSARQRIVQPHLLHGHKA